MEEQAPDVSLEENSQENSYDLSNRSYIIDLIKKEDEKTIRKQIANHITGLAKNTI